MLLSAALAGGVAVVARRARALTQDGAVAAAIVGFIVFGWGRMAAAWPLFVFFTTASALTKVSARLRRRTGTRSVSKRSSRDEKGRRAPQVVANGGVAAAAVAASWLWPHPLWTAAFAGAIATSTADTWATELGVVSRRPPVLITTRKPAVPGQSGAISSVGTMAGAAGAVLIGVVAAATFGHDALGAAETVNAAALAFAVAVGGIVGMLLDSVLGATVQARYRCPNCHVITEECYHKCAATGSDRHHGAPADARSVAADRSRFGRSSTPQRRQRETRVRTVHIGGSPVFNNDVVNFVASLGGAVAAACIYYMASGL